MCSARACILDERAYSVVGVMGQDFQFPDPQTQFWVPFVEANFPRMGGSPVARLKDGVSLQTATAEVGTILQQLRESRPATGGPQPPAPPRYELVGMQDLLVSPVRPALLVLASAVGFVLLIACVNVANLVLARSAARHREIAVRLALGAGRGRLIRQSLAESVLLALVGGAAGIGLAFGGIQLLRSLGAALPRRDVGPGVSLPRLDEIGIDLSVLAFTLAISILTGACVRARTCHSPVAPRVRWTSFAKAPDRRPQDSTCSAAIGCRGCWSSRKSRWRRCCSSAEDC